MLTTDASLETISFQTRALKYFRMGKYDSNVKLSRFFFLVIDCKRLGNGKGGEHRQKRTKITILSDSNCFIVYLKDILQLTS